MNVFLLKPDMLTSVTRPSPQQLSGLTSHVPLSVFRPVFHAEVNRTRELTRKHKLHPYVGFHASFMSTFSHRTTNECSLIDFCSIVINDNEGL